MCGFAGFTWPPGAIAPEDIQQDVRAQLSAVRYRGPDDESQWVAEDQGVALCFARLSIQDTSDAGRQPMISQTGRLVLTFNGEIYNFHQLRQELEAASVNFRGNSDSEVILNAIETWGLEKSINRFHGMFAFALWDRNSRELTLVRDRIGIKPLYYAPTSCGGLVFGSDIRALAQHRKFHAKLNRSMLLPYLEKGYLPGASSILENARKLEPGHYIRWRHSGGLETARPYWKVPYAATKRHTRRGKYDREGAHLEFSDLLAHSVKEHTVADVPVGLFLSSGIDSTALAMGLKEHAANEVTAFTIGFKNTGFDEAPDAARIANTLGIPHTAAYIEEKELLQTAMEAGAVYDEPFADASQIPMIALCRHASREITVALAGDGADELLGGYARYRWLERFNCVYRSLGAGGRQVTSRLLTGRLGKFASYPLSRFSGNKHEVRSGSVQQARLASMLREPSILASYRNFLTLTREGSQLLAPEVAIASRRWGTSDEDHGGAHLRRQLMHADTCDYLPGDILVKTDRASMASGLEARVPYLDHRLLEFCASQPDSFFRVNSSRWKAPISTAVVRHIDPAITRKPKRGFSVPMSQWLRGSLRDWGEAQLDERRLAQQGIFDAKQVRNLWQSHLKHECDEPWALWAIASFQSWLASNEKSVSTG
ncbi:asparagine synthase (glutamine-hydrolyzing) [bacterium]|nr:asparagine synthase (glutamine-hydrolyzing) [bacterium]